MRRRKVKDKLEVIKRGGGDKKHLKLDLSFCGEKVDSKKVKLSLSRALLAYLLLFPYLLAQDMFVYSYSRYPHAIEIIFLKNLNNEKLKEVKEKLSQIVKEIKGIEEFKSICEEHKTFSPTEEKILMNSNFYEEVWAVEKKPCIVKFGSLTELHTDFCTPQEQTLRIKEEILQIKRKYLNCNVYVLGIDKNNPKVWLEILDKIVNNPEFQDSIQIKENAAFEKKNMSIKDVLRIRLK